jgi:hypothetical protein
MIAALYVDVAKGPYAAMEGVDCWGIERDAKTYDGPWPVVAHPPCGPWGSLKGLCTKQDPSCGPRAVEQVRMLGGVLEHPAHSGLWRHCVLPRPGWLPMATGFSLQVDQCRWGHKARKRTWLYIVGCTPVDLPPIPPWREPTHTATSSKRGPGCLPQLWSTEMHLTPPAFAEWLVAVARMCQR